MTQVMPAVDREKLVKRLAIDVTRSPEPPSGDLKMALEQLIDIVTTGEDPDRPIDWAYLISQSVLERHDD